MPGERLHEYDLDLCDYVLGQIRPLLRELPARPQAGCHVPVGDTPTVATCVGSAVAGLPVALADHVWAGVTGDKVCLPLSSAELVALEAAIDGVPDDIAGECVWVPFPALHRMAVECVPEIGAAVTKATAEEWAADSAAYAARLCQDELPLADGIAAVGCWLGRVRQLLGVMGAYRFLPTPLGTHPTPTNPRPVARSGSRRTNRSTGVVGEVGIPEAPEMLSPARVAAKYAVSRSTVYAACRTGALTHYRVSARPGARGKYLVKEDDVVAWLDSLKAGAERPTPPAPDLPPGGPAAPFSELNPERLSKAWRG